MTTKQAERVNWIMGMIERRLCCLHFMWIEQKGFDGWDHYKKLLKIMVKDINGIVLVKVTKRPFGLRVIVDGELRIQFYSNAMYIGWKWF